MYRKLSDDEVKLAVSKVREKYQKIITDFKKPKSMLEAFEDRYLMILKSHIDLSVFLLAEIEAVDEIYKAEDDKKKSKEARMAARKRIRRNESFADKVLKEQEKKTLHYTKAELCSNAEEEIQKLVGAARDLLNDYWPVLNLVFKNHEDNRLKNDINEYYHKLIMTINYKGEPPVAKSYIYALQTIPVNNKKVEFERYYIIKETAFLLNDILTVFNKILKNEKTVFEDKKISVNIDSDNKLKEYFDGMQYKEAFDKVNEYVKKILADFRIRDIKRNS